MQITCHSGITEWPDSRETREFWLRKLFSFFTIQLKTTGIKNNVINNSKAVGVWLENRCEITNSMEITWQFDESVERNDLQQVVGLHNNSLKFYHTSWPLVTYKSLRKLPYSKTTLPLKIIKLLCELKEGSSLHKHA